MLYFQLLHVESLKFEVVLKKLLVLLKSYTYIPKKKRIYISTDLYNLKSIEILGIYT